MASHLEVERKYEAAADLALPDLSDVPGTSGVGAPVELRLEATYLDTVDLRLARRRVTLRRRTGGTDDGWHLKLPASGGDSRTELRAPLDSAGIDAAAGAPPAALTNEVVAYLRDADLLPVAVLRTTRVERALLDGQGAPVALVADDHVTAQRLGDGKVDLETWREVEVELVEPTAVAVLDAVEARLLDAGMRPAAGSSKLARVLGEPALHRPGSALPSDEAGDAVHAYLQAQVDEMIERDRGARADAPDSVHKMRVATRRLRATLATFRPLLDRSRTDPLRAELRWLATALGGARDAEVLKARLLAAVAAQPAELVVGPITDRIDRTLTGRHDAARTALEDVLDSTRYRRLLDHLDDLLDTPPWSERAGRPAARELRRLVGRAVSRARTAHDEAAAVAGTAQLDGRLHEVRKSAKRARYACEVAIPVLGDDAVKAAARWEAVQEVLGEHQDGVVARSVLLDLAATAHAAGESAFTYGRLHGLEGSRSADAVHEYAPTWRKAAGRKARRWLR